MVSTTAAISSGCPSRAMGCRCVQLLSAAARVASAIGVGKIPGRDYEQDTAEKKQYRNRSTLVHHFL
jgi:hypothetical protein